MLLSADMEKAMCWAIWWWCCYLLRLLKKYRGSGNYLIKSFLHDFLNNSRLYWWWLCYENGCIVIVGHLTFHHLLSCQLLCLIWCWFGLLLRLAVMKRLRVYYDHVVAPCNWEEHQLLFLVALLLKSAR